MNEGIFRTCALAVFLIAMGVSVYFRIKADRDSGGGVSWKDEGLWTILALRVGGLVMWLSVIAYLINPDWMAWSTVDLPEAVRWAGVAIGLLCDALVFWLFSSIGSGITPTVETREKHILVTRGPYRWVRHPLYSVGSLLVFSLGLIADSWLIIVMAPLALWLLARRLPNEEAHLIEKFGDEYRAYMKRTGKFLPRLWGE